MTHCQHTCGCRMKGAYISVGDDHSSGAGAGCQRHIEGKSGVVIASRTLPASAVLGFDLLVTWGVPGVCWNTARLLLLRPRATYVEPCKPCQMRPSIVHSGKLAMCTSFPSVRRLPSSSQLKYTTCK